MPVTCRLSTTPLNDVRVKHCCYLILYYWHARMKGDIENQDIFKTKKVFMVLLWRKNSCGFRQRGDDSLDKVVRHLS